MAGARIAAPPAEGPVVPKKREFDLLRPFRYAGCFIEGTIRETLDGTARWARRGAFFGTVGMVVLGILCAANPALLPFTLPFANNLIMLAVTGLCTGVLGGAAFGAVLGAATGGIGNILHHSRREYQADAMARQMEPRRQAAPVPARQGPTYAQAAAAQRRQQAIEINNSRELDMEMQQDHREYIQEQRAAGHHRGPRH